MAADRRLVGDNGALLPYRGSRFPKVFGVEGSDVAVAALDVYCRFSSSSVGIRPFDPILKAFGSIA